MNEKLRADKQAIRAFLRTGVWTEEKLCALLAHAEDKLSYWSCCCLIGCATADHALQSNWNCAGYIGAYAAHLPEARCLPLANVAEMAFCTLSDLRDDDGMLLEDESDAQRRRIIRPIIRAELKRRAPVPTELVAV